MKTDDKATLALLGTVLLWSFMVVIARWIALIVSPITILFYRLLIAAVSFLPFFIKYRTWTKPHFIKLALISLGATINLIFFIIGIKYTSASASQIIYAAMPILILLLGKYYKGERHSLNKIIGVIIGFLGLLLIGFLSSIEKGETISGTLFGNILILIAMLGWTSYLLNSKSLSKYFHPIEMGSTSIIVSFIISAILYGLNQNLMKNPINLNFTFISSVFYMGFAGTFLTYILFQYAIHHSSALKVSLTSYIQPVTTAFLAIIFIGEKLTFYFVVGSILVLIGVLLTSSYSLNILKKLPIFE
ncbi:hypothetical protein A3D78_06655 [Candidatus Gottesmanbacteria bacterium RIFCSPHIGHO2_02_FULL_39_14]|uniref:EamA domain-containing protein n=2 Tax=Candidatus Gottesmaniibacteriota TaxID=1752720 RepID=A0A1F5ZZQ5_9BACT|nr:MAG: hypothetical protein A3D78_06655 [Candidatus Gottesmanbacteria bacterium RIFCSPHIGHO2_02_FULL_39_14]OGG31804.1 MAG: hypothetical protein A3I51_02195 [Candidatus Gottesmanbacteria bacterium RIFCSPLOWO2_02_FULL_38_8]